MKSIPDATGFDLLMGHKITVLCMNYFYTGELVGVGEQDILLKHPKIIYQTGAWVSKDWADAEALPSEYLYVRTAAIEAYGVMK